MHVQLGAYDAGVKASARLLSYGVTGVRDMASPLDDITRRVAAVIRSSRVFTGADLQSLRQ